MTGAGGQRFWDARAREHALHFVDTETDYAEPDAEAFWQRGERVVELMFDLVGLRPDAGDHVLDIGCGVGRLTRALAGRVARVYGLDVSREMLNQARSYNASIDNVDWLLGDGEGLGVLGDACVDGCFSHVVFQHIPDPEVTLHYVREMGRVLRPNGWALFQVSTDPRVHERPRGLRGRLSPRRKSTEPFWWGAATTDTAVRAAAHDGGLDVERVLDEGTQYTTVLARRRRPAKT